jgi:hypothetical protein
VSDLRGGEVGWARRTVGLSKSLPCGGRGASLGLMKVGVRGGSSWKSTSEGLIPVLPDIDRFHELRES